MMLFTSQATEVKKEQYEFGADTGRLLDILINSLYQEKEVFLRELISNASDALDKVRFLSIEKPDILKTNEELKITISINEQDKYISVQDTGIGMTKDDLISNLGTIAKTGTTNYMEAIKGGNINIIGQFGVGFYSAFLVASTVQVRSKHNDDPIQHIWESSAASNFSVQEDTEGNNLKRGTEIRLYLKSDQDQYLRQDILKDLVKKHSEFINFPINLRVSKEVEKEVTDDDGEIKKDGEKKQKKKKKVKQTEWKWEVLNDNKAIWMRDKKEIKPEEYKKFYKSFTKDYDNPISWTHFKTEGNVAFTSLLFTPARAEGNMFENYQHKKSQIKLYVRRVLVSEDFEDLVPKYLSFIKGVVDSDELSINVSRDSIQQAKMLTAMSNKITKNILAMFKSIGAEQEDEYESSSDDDGETEEDENPEDVKAKKEKQRAEYNKFWKEYGKNIKLGVMEDTTNRDALASLTRWYSNKNITELISFDDYKDRKKEGQDAIYYISGEEKKQLLDYPVVKKLVKLGYEVLLCDDPIDEYVFQHLTTYEKTKISNVGKSDFKLPHDDEIERKKLKKITKMYKPLTDWYKKQLSDFKVTEVTISNKLTDESMIVVGDQSAAMLRTQKAQAYSNKERANPYSNESKQVELNPSHPAIKELFNRVKEDGEKVSYDTKQISIALFEAALINSGYTISNTASFNQRFNKLLNSALGLSKDAKIEDVEVDLEDLTEDDKEQKDNKDNKKINDEDLDKDDEVKSSDDDEGQKKDKKKDTNQDL